MISPLITERSSSLEEYRSSTESQRQRKRSRTQENALRHSEYTRRQSHSFSPIGRRNSKTTQSKLPLSSRLLLRPITLLLSTTIKPYEPTLGTYATSCSPTNRNSRTFDCTGSTHLGRDSRNLMLGVHRIEPQNQLSESTRTAYNLMRESVLTSPLPASIDTNACYVEVNTPRRTASPGLLEPRAKRP